MTVDVGAFRAFVAEKGDDGVRTDLTELRDEDLPEGEVTIRVGHSSVNYKDALATIPKGGVAQVSPLVPGIDLAGEVIEADDDELVGTQVIVQGYELGTGRHGGYAEVARVPSDWVVPMPEGMTGSKAMAIGTAGFTAALSVDRLEKAGLTPEAGPVLVTGASGGVGSVAVSILAGKGYEVFASSGKDDASELLLGLGASEVVPRELTSAESKRPLESERWAGAVDPVGGATLAYVLRTLRYGAAVANSGLTGGAGLDTTVLPFILRGVTLIGIDSVQLDIEARRALWRRLADDLEPAGLEALTTEVGLEDVGPVLSSILRGEITGRTVVRVAP